MDADEDDSRSGQGTIGEMMDHGSPLTGTGPSGFDGDDVIDMDTLKQFTIPKRKKTKKELFESLTTDGREHTDIVQAVRQSYREPKSLKHYTYTRPRLVHNDQLLDQYMERKKEMKTEGYSDKELVDTYCFLHVDAEFKHCDKRIIKMIRLSQWHGRAMFMRVRPSNLHRILYPPSAATNQAKKICQEGLKISNTTISSLGNPTMGVYLCKHADILTADPLPSGRVGVLVVFKVIKGKVKFTVANHGGTPIEPTPNFDCHLMKTANLDLSQHSPLSIYQCMQMYLYEYTIDSDLSERPRQICPYAVLDYQYRGMSNVDANRLSLPILHQQPKSVLDVTGRVPFAFLAKHYLGSPGARFNIANGGEVEGLGGQCGGQGRVGSVWCIAYTRLLPVDTGSARQMRIFTKFSEHLLAMQSAGFSLLSRTVHILLLPPCEEAAELGLTNGTSSHSICSSSFLHCLFMSQSLPNASTTSQTLSRMSLQHSIDTAPEKSDIKSCVKQSETSGDYTSGRDNSSTASGVDTKPSIVVPANNDRSAGSRANDKHRETANDATGDVTWDMDITFETPFSEVSRVASSTSLEPVPSTLVMGSSKMEVVSTDKTNISPVSITASITAVLVSQPGPAASSGTLEISPSTSETTAVIVAPSTTSGSIDTTTSLTAETTAGPGSGDTTTAVAPAEPPAAPRDPRLRYSKLLVAATATDKVSEDAKNENLIQPLTRNHLAQMFTKMSDEQDRRNVEIARMNKIKREAAIAQATREVATANKPTATQTAREAAASKAAASKHQTQTGSSKPEKAKSGLLPDPSFQISLLPHPSSGRALLPEPSRRLPAPPKLAQQSKTLLATPSRALLPDPPKSAMTDQSEKSCDNGPVLKDLAREHTDSTVPVETSHERSVTEHRGDRQRTVDREADSSCSAQRMLTDDVRSNKLNRVGALDSRSTSLTDDRTWGAASDKRIEGMIGGRGGDRGRGESKEGERSRGESKEGDGGGSKEGDRSRGESKEGDRSRGGSKECDRGRSGSKEGDRGVGGSRDRDRDRRGSRDDEKGRGVDRGNNRLSSTSRRGDHSSGHDRSPSRRSPPARGNNRSSPSRRDYRERSPLRRGSGGRRSPARRDQDVNGRRGDESRGGREREDGRRDNRRDESMGDRGGRNRAEGRADGRGENYRGGRGGNNPEGGRDREGREPSPMFNPITSPGTDRHHREPSPMFDPRTASANQRAPSGHVTGGAAPADPRRHGGREPSPMFDPRSGASSALSTSRGNEGPVSAISVNNSQRLDPRLNKHQTDVHTASDSAPPLDPRCMDTRLSPGPGIQSLDPRVRSDPRVVPGSSTSVDPRLHSEARFPQGKRDPLDPKSVRLNETDHRDQTNPRGQLDPRGQNDPRGQIDPRGQHDPRGQIDLRGQHDPRGQIDHRGQHDPRGQIDPRGQHVPRGHPDPRGSNDPRGHPDPRDSTDPRGHPDPKLHIDSRLLKIQDGSAARGDPRIRDSREAIVDHPVQRFERPVVDVAARFNQRTAGGGSGPRFDHPTAGGTGLRIGPPLAHQLLKAQLEPDWVDKYASREFYDNPQDIAIPYEQPQRPGLLPPPTLHGQPHDLQDPRPLPRRPDVPEYSTQPRLAPTGHLEHGGVISRGGGGLLPHPAQWSAGGQRPTVINYNHGKDVREPTGDRFAVGIPPHAGGVSPRAPPNLPTYHTLRDSWPVRGEARLEEYRTSNNNELNIGKSGMDGGVVGRLDLAADHRALPRDPRLASRSSGPGSSSGLGQDSANR